MFYCMYYCVYYQNDEMINFILITILECDLATESQQKYISDYLQGIMGTDPANRIGGGVNGENHFPTKEKFEDNELGR